MCSTQIQIVGTDDAIGSGTVSKRQGWETKMQASSINWSVARPFQEENITPAPERKVGRH
jgi:hypothetical protein